uniref:Methyltransferase type 11 domain-containing protein n=1 Tax=Aegilops tauschii TaxID=37682 RepID=M8CCK3_AEGTA
MSSSSPPLSPRGAEEEEEGGARSGGGVGGGTVFSYGEAGYWDARYVWRRASRLPMTGGGSALMSEDMAADGYMEIINIDISSVLIEMMRKKYFDLPQLQYMQMDVRDMSKFSDESFDCAIDKGTLDSLMCGVEAPLSAAQMVLEVDSVSSDCRLLKPGGVFMLITYGDPSARIPHLNQPVCSWKIVLYILPRPGFKGNIRRSVFDPVPLTESGRLPEGFVLEDPDSHYIYVCKKGQELTGIDSPTLSHLKLQDSE